MGSYHFSREVTVQEEGMRVDRWFALHYPGLSHAHLSKLLRKGQVRVEGGKTEVGGRLIAGQSLQIPKFIEENFKKPSSKSLGLSLSDTERKRLLEMTLYEDEEILVFNKPQGFAVQGGTRTHDHLDGLLERWVLPGGERPRLVHRLDRETSGVLVVAKTRHGAASLGRFFSTRTVQKTYLAFAKGIPSPNKGLIDQPLLKISRPKGDRVEVVSPTLSGAQKAVTDYETLSFCKGGIALLKLVPHTGRQHQLRAHMAFLGCPLLGDDKYGGDRGIPFSLTNRLHLHAWKVSFPHPVTRVILAFEAPIPTLFYETAQHLLIDLPQEE